MNKSTKKTIALFALSLLAGTTCGAASIWAPGVSRESGWVDVNKSWNGDNSMCWAAAASNMLEWWQTVYVSAGNSLPENAPSGYVVGRENETTRQYQIFDYFIKNWSNAAGYVYEAIPWYMTGGTVDGFLNNSVSNLVSGADSAGFFKNVYPTSADMASKQSGTWVGDLSVYEYGSGSSMSGNFSSLGEFSNLLIDSFSNASVVSMSVSLYRVSTGERWTGHAITLWGCDYDENGNVTAIHITDSDDQKLQLRTIHLSENESNEIVLDGYWGGAVTKINRFESLSVASIPNIDSVIPEPSAFGLLAGTFALGFAVFRRRKR